MWSYTSTLTNNAESNPTTSVVTLGGDLGVSYEIGVAYTAGTEWKSE